MATIEQWHNRQTARNFVKNYTPDPNTLENIETCLNLLPLQVTHSNRSDPNFFIFRLDPEDSNLKYELVKSVFYIDDPTEYFTSIYEAPYVYLFIEALRDLQPVEKNGNILHTNMGVACGAMITEVIGHGLDACSIACAQATWDYPKQAPAKLRIYKKLANRFHSQIQTIKIAHGKNFDLGSVMMAICVGKRVPLKQKITSATYDMHHELNLPYFAYSKLPRRVQPFSFIR